MPTLEDLRYFQRLPLDIKVAMTKTRIREWVNHYGVGGVYISFSGGKDSTVLLHIARQEYPDIKAKIKETMTVSLEEFGKKAGEYALDEFEYKGLTIRQWADKITSGEYQPVVHGQWERRMTKIYACSECTNEVTDRQRKNYSFCPYCGVLMDGDNNG